MKEKLFRGLSLLIIVVIFWCSHKDGSQTMEQSDYVKEKLDEAVGQNIKFNIRKNAHFFIYMMLGITLLLSRDKKDKKEILEVIGFVILYAISDEFHQSFIPGREATFKDIVIDTLGGVSGVVVLKTVFSTKNTDFYRKSILKRG